MKIGRTVGKTDFDPFNTLLCVSVDAIEGGNYTGTITVIYQIVCTPINKAKITVKNPETGNKNLFAYTGRVKTVKFKIGAKCLRWFYR